MKTVEVETLRKWLEKGQPVTVLDVRPVSERAEWAIPGSIRIDAYKALKANDPEVLAGRGTARRRASGNRLRRRQNKPDRSHAAPEAGHPGPLPGRRYEGVEPRLE